MEYYFEAKKAKERLDRESCKAIIGTRRSYVIYLDKLRGNRADEETMAREMGQSTYDSYILLRDALFAMKIPEELATKVFKFHNDHLRNMEKIWDPVEREEFGNKVANALSELNKFFSLLDKIERYESAISILLIETIKKRKAAASANITDEQRAFIEEIEKEVAELDDYENSEGNHAYELYSDGAIYTTKGGELYGMRSVFTTQPAMILPPVKFPREDGKRSFAILKEEDALRIRAMMEKLRS